MTTIEIDLDVYKAIVQHSEYFNEPANDVLKRLFSLGNQVLQNEKNDVTSSSASGGLTVKNIFFENGLKLRKRLKGNLLEAIVRDGYIEFNNERFNSPSGAAVRAAKGSVNGWRFWDFFDKNDNSWKSLEILRPIQKSSKYFNQ